MASWLALIVDRLAKMAPACLAGIVIMGGGLFTYANANFAKAEDVAESMHQLQQTMEQTTTVLLYRMTLSDADRRVSDIQMQIRTKEREIADLEMVIAEMEGTNNVLANRVFQAKQELRELGDSLTQAQAEQSAARQAYQRAAQ